MLRTTPFGRRPRASVPAAAFVLDFETSPISSLVTFTRSSSGTYFDSAGTLQTASSNVARFDYNPLTLVPLGILAEEARTNSIRNNTMQGAAAGTPGTAPTNWVVTGTGGVFTQTIVGTGTESGITYIDIRYQASGSGNATTQFEFGNQIAASNGQTWTTSSYIKLVGGSLTNVTFNLSLAENDSGGSFLAGADGSAIVPTTAGLAGQRNSYTRTNTNASTAYVYSRLKWAFSGAGDVTLRIGLPQLELGASATSVIATTSAAATRNADNAVISTISPWFNASEGTVVFEGDVNATTADGTARVLWGFSDGTANEAIYSSRNASAATVNYIVNDGGVQQAGANGGSATANTAFKTAVAYKANDFAISMNGAAVVTDTSGTLPTVTGLTIGNGNWSGANNYLNGHIRRLAYYNTRLSNAQLQALSTL